MALKQLRDTDLYQALLSALEKIDLSPFDINKSIHSLDEVYKEILNEDRN